VLPDARVCANDCHRPDPVLDHHSRRPRRLLLSYVTSSLGPSFPLRSAMLSDIDVALGFDWTAMLVRFDRYPTITEIAATSMTRCRRSNSSCHWCSFCFANTEQSQRACRQLVELV